MVRLVELFGFIDFIPSQNRNDVYYAHDASHIFTPKEIFYNYI